MTEFAFAGSISSATLRSEDLIPRFMSVLRSMEPTSAANLEQDVAEALRLLADDAPDAEEVAGETLEQLTDALELAAPSGYVFSSHEGDAADFGFWPDEEDDDRAQSITGKIRLADGSESEFSIGPDGGWQQWGQDADRDRLARSAPILEAMQKALVEDDLLTRE